MNRQQHDPKLYRTLLAALSLLLASGFATAAEPVVAPIPAQPAREQPVQDCKAPAQTTQDKPIRLAWDRVGIMA